MSRGRKGKGLDYFAMLNEAKRLKVEGESKVANEMDTKLKCESTEDKGPLDFDVVMSKASPVDILSEYGFFLREVVQRKLKKCKTFAI